MMWRFADKGGRDVCLVPEITGMAQKAWRDDWSKSNATRNIFYMQRCYRYERPQRGRYREFWQFGIEMMGSTDTPTCAAVLRELLDLTGVPYDFNDTVVRGMNYYNAAGFEASVSSLGSQSQIAGGGSYTEGVGWAIGMDRLVLAAVP